MPGFDDRAEPGPGSGETSPVADGRAWGVCWLMFASTVLNYMDRQTVALLGEPIKAEFGITSNADFGWVLSAFYLTYALFQVPAGYLVDRWDLRRTYALAVAWWSLAAVATAIVPSLGAADRLPGPAGRGRVVQLAGGVAGDGADPAPVGSEPGQRDLQLGGRHRGGGHAGGRHAT